MTIGAGFSASLAELDAESELDSEEEDAASFAFAGFAFSPWESESESEEEEEEDSDDDSGVAFLTFFAGRSLADESDSDEDSDELSGFLRFRGFAVVTGASALAFPTIFFFFGFSCSSSASLSEDDELDEELLEALEEEALFLCDLATFVFGFLVSFLTLEADDFALLEEELLEELEDSSPLAPLSLSELEELELELDFEEEGLLEVVDFCFHAESSCSSVTVVESALTGESIVISLRLSSFANDLDVESSPFSFKKALTRESSSGDGLSPTGALIVGFGGEG